MTWGDGVLVFKWRVLSFISAFIVGVFFVCLILCAVRSGLRRRRFLGVRRNRLDCRFTVKVDGVIMSLYVSPFLYFVLYIHIYICSYSVFILFALFNAVFFGGHPIPVRYSLQFIFLKGGAKVYTACRCSGLEILSSVMAV